ncbi:hypothetical protein JHK82_044694 [Glycine max]|uniref:Uncharacterized protein n=2 Tax=Glycine subgen. Soja TaxID=1462606 RepID=K7MGB5_SOYBN|nr:hypothetical protein JHK86_045089 [Glycine max]KAG4941010.1 hypothetical protein JHK87_044881 [Glycine soja]KAG4951792.1 hypothetical protein JHK85_045659 [Glycine max]KAG5099642.1 hypothetical protein JHK82_044694 [Glycine max]KAG5108241.1 hypothetical protein JHK84_045148 [Glycine max]
MAALDAARDTSGTCSSYIAPKIVRSMRISFILAVSFTACCSTLVCSATCNLAASFAAFLAFITTT